MMAAGRGRRQRERSSVPSASGRHRRRLPARRHLRAPRLTVPSRSATGAASRGHAGLATGAASRGHGGLATGAASRKRRRSPVGRHARRPASRRRLCDSRLTGSRPAPRPWTRSSCSPRSGDDALLRLVREPDPGGAPTPGDRGRRGRGTRRDHRAVGSRLPASGSRLPASGFRLPAPGYRLLPAPAHQPAASLTRRRPGRIFGSVRRKSISGGRRD